MFVVGPRGEVRGLFDERWVRVIVCSGRLKNLPVNSARLVSQLLSRHVEAVHVFTGASTMLGVFALLVGRLSRVPSAMSIFGREDVTIPSPMGRVLFLVAGSLATSISTNSEATRRLLPRRFLPKSHVLLGGGRAVGEARGHARGGKEVLFVGRLVQRKGLDDLLAAMSRVRLSVPSTALVIVGDGPEKGMLIRMAHELGLNDDVKFQGTLTGEPLHEEYERCSVLVLPSKDVPGDTASEGLGLSLIEASMHGKPLVGTMHGGIPEVIQDGVNGLLVPQNDPVRLSEALTRLLLDDGLSCRMGAKALELAKARFTWDAATDRLLQSYVK